MITILPADKAFLESIHAPAGVEAMVLRDAAGTVDGYALFRMEGDAVEVLNVETDEPLMKDGLVRSVLNAGDVRGAVTGICRAEELAPILQRLEFVRKDGVWSLSIEAFFRAGCSSDRP